MSIKHKLFIILLSISVLPIFVITFVSYRGYSDLIQRQVTETASNLLDNSMDKVSRVLDGIVGVSQTLAYQPYSPDNLSVIDVLRRHRGYTANLNHHELLKSQRDLKFVFGNTLYSYSYVNGVYLFAVGGNSFYYARADHDLQLGYRPDDDFWYKHTWEQGSYISEISRQDYLMAPKPTVSFSRLIVDPDTNEPLGVVLINCNIQLFAQMDSNIFPQQSEMFIVNLDGHIEYDRTGGKREIVLSREAREMLASEERGQFMDDQKEWLTLFSKFPQYDWKMVLQVSMSELANQYLPVRVFLIAIAATCCLMFWALSYFLSRMVTRPIVNLSRIMKSEKSNEVLLAGNLLKGSDEIATLYNEYNTMMAENKAIIKERYQNRIILLDSQMKALEAQINSHFLYNTLESINSIADIEGVERITVITKAMGDMFRYSIKTDSERVSLLEEINHVLNYLTIQKMRFGDRLAYEFHVDPRLHNERMLKLILQPLVENAIYHGLEPKEGAGKVAISAVINESILEIQIADDGCGMAPEELQRLERQLRVPAQFTQMGRRENGSMGVSNVHARIQLYYTDVSEAIGISLESKPGQGTTVYVRLPRLE